MERIERGLEVLGNTPWKHGESLKVNFATLFLLLLLLCAGPPTLLAQSETGSAPALEEAEPQADPNLVESEAPGEEASSPEHGGIEEILVTAQKRSSNLQQTPTAITALSGAQLFDRGIYDVESLATQVPNFQYGENFGIARLTIRGIGNEGFTDPSTAFHIDGVYQNNQTAAGALTFYDIAQVEVLRGPQGTLWGRNSTAGAINVSTRGPTHEFEIFGDQLYGSYDQWFGRGVVNVPILADRIAVRTAAYYDLRDGYQDNLAVPGDSQDAGDARNWGIRPQVLFELTDEASLTMRGGYNHQGGVGWANKILGPYPDSYIFAVNENVLGPLNAYTWMDPYHSDIGGVPMQPNPTDPRQIRLDTPQFQDISTWDVNGTLEWDLYNSLLGDLNFTLIGSYREENRAQNFDVDLSDQAMSISNVTARTRDRVIDAHLRNAGSGNIEWLIGFFMLDADGRLNVDLPGGGGATNVFVGQGGRICLATSPPLPDCPDLTANPGLATLGDISIYGGRVGGSNDSLSLAGYGNVRLKFFEDTLRVGLGLRYSYDRSKARRYTDEVSALAPGTTAFGQLVFPPGDNCIQPGADVSGDDSWDGVTGDFKVEFLPNDEHMVYVSISRGYKPGYINGDAVGLGCGDPAGAPPVPANRTPLPNALSEEIWAYEIGSKNRFLDNTVQANFTVFAYQYENLQVNSSFANTTYVQNASRARVRGVEFEGIWEPINDLNLSLTYGYLDARYSEYFGFDFSTGQPDNFSGNRMIRAPENSATMAAEYVWDLAEYGSIIPRIQYYISDEIYFGASNLEQDREPSYGNLQIRARWESRDDDIFVEGFVQNLTDEDVRSTRAIGTALLGRPVTAAYEPPRTWGIRVGGSY